MYICMYIYIYIYMCVCMRVCIRHHGRCLIWIVCMYVCAYVNILHFSHSFNSCFYYKNVCIICMHVCTGNTYLYINTATIFNPCKKWSNSISAHSPHSNWSLLLSTLRVWMPIYIYIYVYIYIYIYVYRYIHIPVN